MILSKYLRQILQLSVIVVCLLVGFSSSAQAMRIGLSLLGTYETGIFDDSAAEIPAYDPNTRRLFVTNSANNGVDILDINNPTNPTFIGNIAAPGVNSVAVQNGLVAIAQAASEVTAPGIVSFFDTNGNPINTVGVGSLPDMLTFTPDGSKILVANEGEPNEPYTVDPEGSISIIDVDTLNVMTAGFGGFNDQIDDLRDQGVRIFGPNATVAQDLEPEFITVSADSSTAWVSLQENNAFALVDIANAMVTDIIPLGFKDHSSPENGLDASDRDGEINIQSYPNLLGMYQPDTIDSYTVDGKTYIVTANEGDGRDYDGFSEEERVEDLTLDGEAFADPDIQNQDQLGRLTVTNTLGDTDSDDDFDQLYAFGSRSFSIWDEDGNLVWDSGDDFERQVALFLPEFFNSDNDEATFDTRSDNRGPEPEALSVGMIGDRVYAFVGLERVGGIMIYDITNPNRPFFVSYSNNRDFTQPPQTPDGFSNPLALDSGPEGILFITNDDSPIRSDLLVVTNEVSGTTSIYAVSKVPEPTTILGLMMVGLIGSVKALKRL
ncbi:MAG: choice-of-anchor I family protein [Crocosphaera sp.]|nr:choice-of-anchor I family protein [Crocosphaera sp.]